MCEVLDRIEAKGGLDMLINLVQKGLLSVTDASKEANMTVEEFQKFLDQA